MLSEKLINELNEQIKYEFASANYYLSMAAYFAEKSLDGFTNFFLAQADEERFHAMKIFHFLNDLGAKIKITGYEDPKQDFASIKEVFELALQHEQFVTERINTLMEIAESEKHNPTKSFLLWFVDEQVEEENLMQSIIDKLDLIGESGAGLYMLDKELGARTFTPEA